MKTYKHSRLNTILTLLMLFLLVSLNVNCKGACIQEWTACADRCPTEEEGEEAADACFKACPKKDYTCQVECQRKTRVECLGECGKQLQRCLGKEE